MLKDQLHLCKIQNSLQKAFETMLLINICLVNLMYLRTFSS
jgi:hypothetical protein